jgi:hypothetical protein
MELSMDRHHDRARHQAARGTLFALTLGGIILAASGAPVAAGGCTFVAAVDPAPDEVGSAALTVEVGDVVTLWGTFVPNATVELFFEHDGVPFGNFTPGIADAAGEFLFVHDFVEGQEGTWTVTAAVPETECAGTVTITVLAASGTTPSPTPTPAGTAQPLPDTAIATPMQQTTTAIVFVIALLGALTAGAALAVRRAVAS